MSEETMGWEGRARHVLTWAGFGLWGLLGGYALSCGIGLLALTELQLRVVRRTLHRRKGVMPVERRGFGAGSVVFLAFVGLLAATSCGTLMGGGRHTWAHTLLAAGSGLAGAGLFGLLMSPLFALPMVLVDPERPNGFLDAVLVSGAMLGVAPVRGALSAAGIAALVVLPGVVSVYSGNAHGLALAGLTSPLVGHLTARWYLARRDKVEATPSMRPLARGLRALIALDALLCAVLVAQLFSATLTPSPLSPESSALPAGDAPELYSLPVALRGGHVWLRPHPGGLSVEAADGGGAGAVRTRDGVAIASVEVESHADGADDPWIGVRAPGGLRYRLCLDARGVRCDDSWTQRLSARTPWLALVPLFLSMLVALRFGLGQAGALFARARLVTLRERGEERGVVALRGKLVLGPGASLAPAWGLAAVALRLRVRGDVRLDAGDARLRLPEGIVAAAAARDDAGSWRDGARATVVGKFERTVSGGFREAELKLPSGAWWVLGDPAEAEERLAARASVAALRMFALLGVTLVLAVMVLGFAGI